MSASSQPQQPYTNVSQGRMPIPAWAKTTLLGGSLVAAVAAVTWFLIIPHSPKPKAQQTVAWVPGPEISLPNVDIKPSAESKADLPGPTTTQAPAIRRMRVWGGDSGNVGIPGSQASARYGQNAGSQRSLGNFSGSSPQEDTSGPAASEYGAMLTPTKTHMTEAGIYADYSLLLPEGKDFGCLLKSPLDNQLPGGIVCITTEDVWSADGTNIVINKWAKVKGQITRGTGLGQDRAFILWTSVESKQVHAELNSPGTDSLGQIGVPGYVDEHLWPKIKAAVLLTGIESAGSTAQALASRGNGNTNLSFSQGQSLASQALQHDINIPTTIFVGQATEMRVYVQHDIQFRRAYNNVLVAGVR